MNLTEWAARWAVSPQALAELAACSIVEPDPDNLVGGKTEAYVQSAIRGIEAPSKGVFLWRNNVGAGSIYKDTDLCDTCRHSLQHKKRPVRWGLANDSTRVNKVMKSADLIGLRPLIVTDDMVGKRIAQFVSRECKREDWRYTGTEEELAQLAWATIINDNGGDAKIVKAVGSL
jgi:hypothetical protein